ncbi:MAG: FAD-dependent oxidoreductase [Melioribacteraceae bacterium]|nr:FAD-dependent oxidoreductase [Melioribacteraceae bacterium]
MNTDFDYIIYGASLSGCLLAEKMTAKGKKILLLNNFGFPGSSLTEGLNCLQTINNIKNNSVQKIINDIKLDKHGILSECETHCVLNPETIKFQLQKSVQDSDLEILFHAKPVEIKNDNTLLVALKDGIKKFKFNKLIDMTDNLSLYKSMSLNSVQTKFIEINFIINKSEEKNPIEFKHIREIVKLNDGRFWVSLQIDGKDTTNENIQTIIDNFSKLLLNSNRRIQLLPSEYIYTFSQFYNPEKSRLLTKYDLTNRLYKTDEIFIEAEHILSTNI